MIHFLFTYRKSYAFPRKVKGEIKTFKAFFHSTSKSISVFTNKCFEVFKILLNLNHIAFRIFMM